jgi:hypothetical protein
MPAAVEVIHRRLRSVGGSRRWDAVSGAVTHEAAFDPDSGIDVEEDD